jgi:hypothetical protein
MASPFEEFRRAIKHSLGSLVFFIFLLAAAVGLSYLEELLQAWHRPIWLTFLAHWGSVAAAVADAIVFGKLLWSGIMHNFAPKE